VLSNRRAQPAGPASRARSARSYTTKTRWVAAAYGPFDRSLNALCAADRGGRRRGGRGVGGKRAGAPPTLDSTVRACHRIAACRNPSVRRSCKSKSRSVWRQRRRAGRATRYPPRCALHRAGLTGWSCAVPQSDLMFQRESAKGMGEDEEKFDDSIDVNQTYSWHDKYRPRKPRYFNRVHTGCAAADCAPLARAALSAQRGVAVSAATTGTSTTRRTTTTTTPRRRSCRGTSSTCAASCRVAGGARASHRPPLRADILPGPH